jgi:ribosome biogenesis GTPase
MAEPHATPDGTGLAGLGWDDGRAAEMAAHAAAGRSPARVIAVHRETAIVRNAAGADHPATVSGRFRHDALGTADFPAVGEWVALEPADAGAGSPRDGGAGDPPPAMVAAGLPRRGVIVRRTGDESRGGGALDGDGQVLAANVDVGLLVAGLDGDLNVRRIERYLAVVRSGGVAPVVVLNKADLLADPLERAHEVWAVAPGVPVVAISATTGAGLDEVGAHLLPGRTAVLLGSSGVGKSTLLNALLGEARQAIGDVRAGDSRGRHTTTHRELFRLPGGGLLIDTPGVRAIDVSGAGEGVATTFEDIEALAGDCRFGDCRHASEPGCAVLAAVDDGRLEAGRLEAHRQLERESAHVARASDPNARAAERRRHRVIHTSVRRHMKHKYGEDPR